MKPVACLLLVLLGLIVSPADAETAYVTDRLRLGVHAAQDTSDRAFISLKSGDAVEVLQRNGSFVQVRLTDGREGWVRGAFLLDKEPAVRKLARLQAERDQLEAELQSRPDAEGQADQAESIGRLRDEAERARSQAAVLRGELAEMREVTAKLRAQSSRHRFSMPLTWVVGLVVAALCLGALFAWRWFDRLSRQRHGGFRIY